MKEFKRPDLAFRFAVPFIRFGEFDMAGVLYHGNYFHLYENVRELLFRNANLPYDRYASNDQHMAITETQQNFIGPLYYGQSYTLYLWAEVIKKTNVILCYEIEDSEHKIVHRAYTKMAFVAKEKDSFRVSSMPAELIRLFQSIENK
ncbi:MAG: acyl-CoA thioesterase [Deltaproteobacteria bacterium]|nr:acyl-CoA thioesterase [Deltaproteobacteria bacterium]